MGALATKIMCFFGNPRKDKEKKEKKNIEKTQQKITEQDKCVLELKVQKDRLEKQKKKITADAETMKQRIIKLMKDGHKDRAKTVLRMKKSVEKQVQQLEQQMLNLEEMVNSIEFAKYQKDVFKALEAGKTTLNKLNEEVSLEKVEKLMDDTAEAIAYQEEVAQALGQSLTQTDEVDVQKELDALDELQALEIKHELPTVQETKTTTVTEAKEDKVEKKVAEKQQPVLVSA